MQVDTFLGDLSKLTKEDEQVLHFRKVCKECTARDLEMVCINNTDEENKGSFFTCFVLFQIIRLIKHDIRINSGPKHILEALCKDAYPAYQSSRNLGYVVAKYGDSVHSNKLDCGGAPKIKKVCCV